MAEYIERGALLEKAMNGIVAAIDVLYAPAADVAPVVHGEWNIYRWNCESRDYKGKVVEAECSECGAVLEIPMFLFGLCYNYCPNCGADMRERKGDDA